MLGPVWEAATRSVAVVEGAVEDARVPTDADETLAAIIVAVAVAVAAAVAVAGGTPVGDDITGLDWIWFWISLVELRTAAGLAVAFGVETAELFW